MRTESFGKITLTVSSFAVDVEDTVQRYVITGTPDFSSNPTVNVTATGTPIAGTAFDFEWRAVPTGSTSSTVDFFGTTQPSNLLTKSHLVQVRYDGSAYHVNFFIDASEDDVIATDMIADNAIDNDKIATDAVNADSILAGAVDTAEIATDAVTANEIAALAVDTAELAADAVETAKIADNAVTLAKMAGLSATNLILGDASNDPAAVTLSGDEVISNAGAITHTNTETIVIPVSFAAATTLGKYRFKVPYNCTINSVYGVATDTILTDNATAAIYDSTDTIVTGSTITFTATDTIGTGSTATVTGNANVDADEIMYVLVAKTTTPGGSGLLSIKVTKRAT